MMKAGVIGHPVGHSLSPMIHTYWLEWHRLAGTYDKIDVPPGTLADAVRRLVEAGYTGFNVTIPYKTDIMPLCATLDDAARAVGAVNTVVIRDGILHGMNTDSYGFVRGMAAVENFDIMGRTAVVFGAGGAARAVVHGLRHAGVKWLSVCARTPEKFADGLADEVLPWAEAQDAVGMADILVNATPLGMTGYDRGADATALPDLAGLSPDAVVCDIVYRPLETPLLRAAAKRGCRTVDGLGMLLHQAAGAFAQWTGVLPAVNDELRNKVAEAAK
jgi:shikimate dehydrogenase